MTAPKVKTTVGKWDEAIAAAGADAPTVQLEAIPAQAEQPDRWLTYQFADIAGVHTIIDDLLKRGIIRPGLGLL